MSDRTGTVAITVKKSDVLVFTDNDGRELATVIINEKQVGTGEYARPQSPTSFRWGMYVGDRPITYDAMILFSGVTIKKVK